MKYLVVTGGVVSGLGKGISISSMGVLLKTHGLKCTRYAALRSLSRALSLSLSLSLSPFLRALARHACEYPTPHALPPPPPLYMPAPAQHQD